LGVVLGGGGFVMHLTQGHTTLTNSQTRTQQYGDKEMMKML